MKLINIATDIRVIEQIIRVILYPDNRVMDMNPLNPRCKYFFPFHTNNRNEIITHRETLYDKFCSKI